MLLHPREQTCDDATPSRAPEDIIHRELLSRSKSSGPRRQSGIRVDFVVVSINLLVQFQHCFASLMDGSDCSDDLIIDIPIVKLTQKLTNIGNKSFGFF